jgi:hypothetical protein
LNGAGWLGPHDIPGSLVGQLAEVNGRPAVAVFGWSGDCYYLRATDIDGAAWEWGGLSGTIRSQAESNLSLVVANGHPAVAYADDADNVTFVRALDQDGETWPAPLAWPDTEATYTSMAVVNGKPFIAYTTPSGQLEYLQATSPSGAAWVPPARLYESGTTACAVAAVQGRPAISFRLGNSLCCRLAQDSEATGWAPTVFLSPQSDTLPPWSTAIADIGGSPVVCGTILDEAYPTLMYYSGF